MNTGYKTTWKPKGSLFKAAESIKRDPLGEARGLADEFPWLCAKFGASIIPQVVSICPETGQPVLLPFKTKGDEIVEQISVISTPTETPPRRSPQELASRRPHKGRTRFSNPDMQRVSPTRSSNSPKSGLASKVGTPETPPSQRSPQRSPQSSRSAASTGSPQFPWWLTITPWFRKISLENPCTPPDPYVVVFFDDDQKQENLRKICIRGYRIDDAVVLAVGICLRWYGTVNALALESCGITSRMLEILAKYLCETQTVRSVVLDGNPIPDQSHATLLQECTGLERLCLRMCEINNVGAQKLAAQLEYRDPPYNQTLIYLNLTQNNIGDKGVQCLAHALRSNRTLIELTIANNKVGDVGATALATVSQKFPLTTEELRYRTRRSRARTSLQSAMVKLRLKELRRSDIPPRPQSLPETSRRKSNRRRLISPQSRQRISTEVQETISFDKHPFIWDARPEGLDLWCIGNFNLKHIDLSYNVISTRGVHKFLEAIQYQAKLKDTESKEGGLVNILLQGNKLPPNSYELDKIQEILTVPLREKRLKKVKLIPKTKKRQVDEKTAPSREQKSGTSGRPVSPKIEKGESSDTTERRREVQTPSIPRKYLIKTVEKLRHKISDPSDKPSQGSEETRAIEPAEGGEKSIASKTPTGSERKKARTIPTGSEKLKERKTPARSEKLKASKTPAGSEKLKASKTPAGSEKLKASKTPAGSEELKTSKTPKGSAKMKARKTPTGSEKLKARKTPSGSEESKASKASTESDESKASKTPTGSEESKASKPSTGSDESKERKTPTGSGKLKARKTPRGNAKSKASKTSTGSEISKTSVLGAEKEKSEDSGSSESSEEIKKSKKTMSVPTIERIASGLPRESFTGSGATINSLYNKSLEI